MNKKLLPLLLTLFISSSMIAQTPGQNQTDNFEDNTVQGWKHGAPNANEPVNIATDGPTGVDDHFLRNRNGEFGNKHVMLNQDVRWLGNFTSQGILAIRMDVRNSGVNDLHLRVAFRGGAGPSWISTTNAVIVPVGSGWVTIEIPILESDFVITDDLGDTIASVLASQSVAGQIRILSNDGNHFPWHHGDLRDQISDYDNITAATSLLSVGDQELLNSFSISPNPGKDRLNLKLSGLNNTNLEVFDVLGKKIFADRLTKASTSVDVSQWNSGVYLVRLTTDTGTQTKRFVKQ
jgi:Secretion system C-terminal sorting domain